MMGPIEALKLAITKEQESIDLYSRINLENPGLKETMLFLINEEYKHKQLLEKKVAELTKY
jgi:rubrerythrin